MNFWYECPKGVEDSLHSVASKFILVKSVKDLACFRIHLPDVGEKKYLSSANTVGFFINSKTRGWDTTASVLVSFLAEDFNSN